MLTRVTLDDLFPRAGYGVEPIEGIFRGAARGRCWICGRRTRWVSLGFETHICSMVCDDLAWTRYWRDGRARPVVEDG